jgi:uncharacterized protein YggT (Ycf19 family)
MILLQLVYLLTNGIFSFIGFLLGLRIFLKLLNASVGAPFVAWLYQTTEPFIAPFSGIFPNLQIITGFVIELSSIFALIVYSLVGYFVSNLISGLISQEAKKAKKHHE